MKRTKVTRLLLALVLIGTVNQAMADNPASRNLNRLQQELPDFSSPTSPEPKEKAFSLPPLNEQEIEAQKPLGMAVTIQQVVFNGNTVFDEAILQSLAEPYLEKVIDVAEIEALRFKITQYYIQQGYVNSGALVPQQTLKDGILKVEIIEGQLNEINIEGEGWLNPDYIRSRLYRDEPFNVNELQERYLLLLNDPLIQNLNANYKALPEMGQSALDLTVTRARPYQIALHYNNYNPPSIGAEQIQVEGWVRNLTGWGDKFNFYYDNSEGAETYDGGFSIPLTSQGTLFEFYFDIGRSSIVEEPLAEVDIQSKVQNYIWTLSHPFYQDSQQSLTLGVSFASRRSKTSILNEDFSFLTGEDSGRTKVTVIRAFQEYMARFESQVLAFRSTFNIGIDAFDSTIHENKRIQDSEFFSWLGQLQYAYKLGDQGAQIRLRSNMQISDQTLLPQERMAIGGIYSVRGYRENELVRDNGYTGSIELHYPLFAMSGDFANSLTLIPFMDYGLGWNDHNSTDELHSVGIGLNWHILDHIEAEFYYAHDLITPTKKDSYDLQDSGIHFNVSLYAF